MPPLNQRPKAVDVGGVDLPADVLSGAVTDGVVRQAAPSKAAVPHMLVGRHDVNLVRNRLVHEATLGRSIDSRRGMVHGGGMAPGRNGKLSPTSGRTDR